MSLANPVFSDNACASPPDRVAERAALRGGLHDAAALSAAGIWPADALHADSARVLPTGHVALDAELPGGGWPLGALVEILQPAPDAVVWPMLLPALAAAPGQVVLVNPPHEPYLPPLTSAGLAPTRLLWLTAPTPAAQLWASEQALRCQDVAAVLAWLPRVRAAELRRLQQAAAQTGALLFVLRPDNHAVDTASPARVRLRLTSVNPAPGKARLQLVGEGAAPPAEACGTLPRLRVDLLKRRGPPLPTPLWLPACGEVVAALAQAARQQAGHFGSTPMECAAEIESRVPAIALIRPAAASLVLQHPTRQRSSVHARDPGEGSHALAGAAVAAA